MTEAYKQLQARYKSSDYSDEELGAEIEALKLEAIEDAARVHCTRKVKDPRQFAHAAMREGLGAVEDNYEIKGYYTDSGNPVLVEF